jgi:hypothetical protein
MMAERPNNQSDRETWGRWYEAEIAAGRTERLRRRHQLPRVSGPAARLDARGCAELSRCAPRRRRLHPRHDERMILGRPVARPGVKSERRVQSALDAYSAEYERRCAAEAPVVAAVLDRPETVVAYVVYATG